MRTFNKENYDAFLEELISLCNKKESFNITDLITVHNVSAYTFKGLKELKYIEPLANGTMQFHNSKLESIEDIVDNLTYWISNRRKEIRKIKDKESKVTTVLNEDPKINGRKLSILNPSTVTTKEDIKEEPKPEPAKQFNLSTALDLMTEIMSIGIKYGVDQAKIKDFVKDIMVLKGIKQE